MTHNIAARTNKPEEANGFDGYLKAETRRIQVLQAGSILFGIFEDEIATIEDWRPPTQLPHAPSAVLGVVAIQGRILTTLDPIALFGEFSENQNSHRRIVALRGDEQLALAIDEKADVVEMVVKDIQQPDATGGVILGTFRHQGRIVNLLDSKALFPAALKGRERRQRRF